MPAVSTCVLFLQLIFLLLFIFLERFNCCLQFGILLYQSIYLSFMILPILHRLFFLSNYSLNLFLQSLNFFPLALSNLLCLLPPKLTVLQFNSKKVNLSFFLLNDLSSLRFEVLNFFSNDVLIAKCLMCELLCFVCNPRWLDGELGIRKVAFLVAGIYGIKFDWRLKGTESVFFWLVLIQVISVLLPEKWVGIVCVHFNINFIKERSLVFWLWWWWNDDILWGFMKISGVHVRDRGMSQGGACVVPCQSPYRGWVSLRIQGFYIS